MSPDDAQRFEGAITTTRDEGGNRVVADIIDGRVTNQSATLELCCARGRRSGFEPVIRRDICEQCGWDVVGEAAACRRCGLPGRNASVQTKRQYRQDRFLSGITQVGLYCMASYFMDRLGSALTAGLTSAGVFLVSVGLLGRLWLALLRSTSNNLRSKRRPTHPAPPAVEARVDTAA